MSALVPVAAAGVASLDLTRRVETHRLPARLPASVARALILRTVTPDYETQPPGLRVVSLRIEGEIPQEDLTRALEATREAMRPGKPSDCLQATARLRAVARMRPTITDDERLALIVYSEKLSAFPADVVAMASEQWLEMSPFWPSVSELLRMCEWAIQPRRALALELMRKLPEQPYEARPAHA
jgi:hypothetical protein